MRLIDADELKERVLAYHAVKLEHTKLNHHKDLVHEVVTDIALGIDASPTLVVFCRECKHRNTDNCLEYFYDEGGFGYDLTRDSDYCVFGERNKSGN